MGSTPSSSIVKALAVGYGKGGKIACPGNGLEWNQHVESRAIDIVDFVGSDSGGWKQVLRADGSTRNEPHRIRPIEVYFV